MSIVCRVGFFLHYIVKAILTNTLYLIFLTKISQLSVPISLVPNFIQDVENQNQNQVPIGSPNIVPNIVTKFVQDIQNQDSTPTSNLNVIDFPGLVSLLNEQSKNLREQSNLIISLHKIIEGLNARLEELSKTEHIKTKLY